MSTWRQEIAEAVTPIEGVNDVTAILTWNIVAEQNPYSPIPGESGTVRVSRTVKIKGVTEIDARLIDGKNFVAGDFVTEISYLRYLDARKPLRGDPTMVKTLDEIRPLSGDYGIKNGVDSLSVGGNEWKIRRVTAIGLMNDESTGEPVPAKLRFTLRK